MALGPANQVLEVSVSTNDDARRLAEAGCPHGTWVSAKRQSAGRGRLGRQWSSLEGNLFLSIVVRPEGPKSLWSWVPLASAIAIAESAAKLSPALALEIKWPNDLWLGGDKVGGILCEAAGTYIVIGIGVNCVAAPENVGQPATALSSALPGITADHLRLRGVDAVTAIVDELMSLGPEAIVPRYEALAALRKGTAVEWSSGLPGAETSSGAVEGLGNSGELRVRDASGKTHSLYAEEVKIRRRPSLAP
jgi:BirA family biotin operon repressor/biotin-[acetyl-CoA-carboxylase] ligase